MQAWVSRLLHANFLMHVIPVLWSSPESKSCPKCNCSIVGSCQYWVLTMTLLMTVSSQCATLIWWELGRVCINPSEMDQQHHYGVRTDNCDKSEVNTQAASWHLKTILNGSSHTMSQSILESWSSKVICILHSWFVNDLVWEALRLQKQNKQKLSSKKFLSFVQKTFLYIGQCAASFPDSKKIVWRTDGAEECTN